MPAWVMVAVALLVAATFVAVDWRHRSLWRRWAQWQKVPVDVQAQPTWWPIVMLSAVALVAAVVPASSSFPTAWALVVPVAMVLVRLAIRIHGLRAVPRVPSGAGDQPATKP
jgi:hypothetical protein